MAKRLTEEMVIARTKISDLSKVKRLNCWGSELVDVSLLRRIPNVEVLSLSINKINTLADFQFCKRLEELYIRQNDIRDINEIVYLQNLPNLKNLWLGENPCANIDGYRLAVLRALPQLQKLDNVGVTQEELKDAQKRGKTLCHPEDEQEESEEEAYESRPPPSSPQQYVRYEQYAEPAKYSPVERDPRQESESYEPEDSEDQYTRDEASEESRDYSPPVQQSPPTRRAEQHSAPARRNYSPEQQEYVVERRRNSYDRESSPRQPPQQQYYDSKSSTNNSFDDQQCHHSSCESSGTYRETKIVTSQSASCIKEYMNGDKFIHSQYRNEGSESSQTNDNKRFSCPAAAAPRGPFVRRPVTRNSNILSAVLCLVKELDYPSLEVVEMAVRCRMDEIDE